MELLNALSNRLELVTKNNTVYVMKYYTPVSQVFLDLQNLQNVVKKIKDFTLPKSKVLTLKKNVFDKPFYRSQYIKNIIPLSKIQDRRDFIYKLVYTLNDLHRIKCDKNIAWFNIHSKLKLFWTLANINDREMYKIFCLSLDICDGITNSKLPKCLCHNDLVDGNMLLFKEKVKLIDFDFCCMNYRLFDICSFVTENSISNQEKNYFLNLINLDRIEKELYEKMVIVQNILWSFWAIYYFKNTNRKIYWEIAKKKLSSFSSSYSYLNKLYQQL